MATSVQPSRRDRAIPVARALTLAVLASAVGACGGGGGGNTRADPPPQSPPPVPAPPPPAPPPPVVEPPDPAYSGHVIATNAGAAHAAGITGAGVRIGFIDSGVRRSHPALAGRVVASLVYLDPSKNNLAVDDVAGHGTAVAQAAAGAAFGRWPGGIAPGAQIVSARIIGDAPPADDGSGDGNEVDGALGLAPVHADLVARGVRVMNNSWGGLYWTNPAATLPIAEEYRRFVVDNDGLVVFASGNNGRPDPTDTAALPSMTGTGGATPGAWLGRGWITVSALDRDNPGQLAAYSNACGIAMDYCMVAPGSVVVTGKDDDPATPTYWRWEGTSLAAPLVSGAAALVWEAFPYFDNDLVRQTLLGTATDLGATGVDALFGHGRLDAGKAAGGPARLDWGPVTVRFDGITSTWRNTLSGQAQVGKLGSGTLVLAADALNTGGVRVAGGGLQAGGRVAGDVRVDAPGRFTGGTSIGGNVDNAGRFDVRAPAAATGSARLTLPVEGNFVQRDGATLGLELGTRLEVAGTATVEGGNLEVLGVRRGYTTASREELLSSAAGFSGSFDALTAAPGVFLDASLAYTPSQVLLDIRRLDVAAAALSLSGVTPAAVSSAQRVEGAFRRLDAEEGNGAPVEAPVPSGFIAAAGEIQRIGSEAAARAALSSLSGEAHAAAAALTFDAVDLGRRALSSRFGDLAAGGQAAGGWSRALGQGGRGGYLGNEVASHGWLVGRDQRLGTGAVTGFAFGESQARDAGGGDRRHDRQLQGQAYAGALRGNGYVLGQAGAGRFERDIARLLFTGAAAHGVSSRYAGDVRTASLEAGYRFDAGLASVTPYVGADYTRLSSDGFREDGGAGLGLRTRDWSASRSQAIAGLQLERHWAGLRLQAYGEWQQTLATRGLEIDASFVGIEAWSPLPGMAPARSGGLLGIGADILIGRDALLQLAFDQRLGPRGDARMVSLRYALGF